MDKLELGVFTNHDDAEKVIKSLEAEGYDPKDMSIIMKDYRKGQDISESTGARVSRGAVSGATTGGLLGAAAGLLIGVGAITIPGVGALLIGGPIAAALGLTGAAATTISGAVTGIVAGGLVGALIRLGVPENQARVYERHISEWAILLAVPTASADEDHVREVLESHGATNISSIDNVAPQREERTETQRVTRRATPVRSRTREERTTEREDHVVANPVKVQKFLSGVDYPASRDELVGYAIDQGADEDVKWTLQRMHNRRYRSPRQVSEEIGKMK